MQKTLPQLKKHLTGQDYTTKETLNKLAFNSLYNPCRQQKELECGPMPNVMAALSNIGGALCSTPQTLADTHY